MTIALRHRLCQRLPVVELAAAVRRATGQPLRRAAPLSQLAVAGAVSCLPDNAAGQPLALLWQSTYGPRAETLTLLEEICHGTGEPLPYDFLASQPAIAAAQLKPWLPALDTVHHLPLADEARTQWALMLTLARHWLAAGRFADVLCAHLDIAGDMATGDWLLLTFRPVANPLAVLTVPTAGAADLIVDSGDFPARLDALLARPGDGRHRLRLHSPALPKLAVEFAR